MCDGSVSCWHHITESCTIYRETCGQYDDDEDDDVEKATVKHGLSMKRDAPEECGQGIHWWGG